MPAGRKYRLALGTVQFGLPYGIANRTGQVSLAEAASILRYGRSVGIDTLDTAVGYGDSERRLGEIGVEDWRVITKLPAVPAACDDVEQWLHATITQCLARLGLRQLYGVLLHRPQQLIEPSGPALYRALERVRDSGRVAKIGVSIYDPAELDAFASRFQLDLVQAPLNLIDRRLVDSGWLRRLSDCGTEVHVRSAFLQGLLLMDRELRPRAFDRWSPAWIRYENWLKDTGLTPIQACLRFATSFAEIDRIVVGVDSVTHLREIVDALDAPLSATPDFPDELSVNDPELVNPGKWL